MAKQKPKSKEQVTKELNKNDIFTAEQVKKYEILTAEISTTSMAISNNQMKISGLFATISREELYKINGYDSIYAFACDKFMYEGSKGQLSDMINTFLRFGKVETITGENDEISYVYSVKDEFALYSFSQLKLMRKLKDEDLEKVNPSITTRALAEMIKSYKALPKNEEQPEQAEATEQAEQPEQAENVSRETSVKVEDSGQVEPYVEMTFSIADFADMEAEAIKSMILEAFKAGNNVHLNYKFD